MATIATRKYIAQRQVLAKITRLAGQTLGADFTEYFAQVSGGEVTASVERIYVGGEKFPFVLCAPAEIGDITITAHYSEDDRAKLKQWRTAVGKTYYQIDVYDLDCDFIAAPTAQRQYPKALLVGLTEPEGDSSSGAPTTFTLTFAISGEPSSS